MKAVGLHPDVVVVTSRFWQTTCTLVRSGEEAFCAGADLTDRPSGERWLLDLWRQPADDSLHHEQ